MAENTEIIEALEALSAHCRPPLMAVDQRALWLRDWCSDLRGFPIEAIRSATRRWRQGESAKFPMAGQLLPLVRSHVGELEGGEKRRAKAWEPLTDAEYAAASLSDKIDHHTNSAHAAKMKAGPQWQNGKPVAAEDMPETWRYWRGQAANHMTEAQRLKGFLKDTRP